MFMNTSVEKRIQKMDSVEIESFVVTMNTLKNDGY